MRLLKIWASLRYDCHTHIVPSELRLSPAGLSTTLRKTKTTGGARRVSELPIFIGINSYLWKKDWLDVGFKLMKDMADYERDYLLPCGTPDAEAVVRKMAR